ncbi:hypothetical protein V8J36_11795 [Frigidibacter sp. MR17.14]|uniref:hypothetical protein n=1 Tax=Frigidibacter sp. MR17.14 TaxID=3126509 RepID=UPI0030131C24
MSNNDSFIDEVTDEVRRDRLFALLKRWGWVGIVGVVLIVGGAAFWEWRRSAAEAEARAFGDAVMAAMQAESLAARTEALAGLPEGSPERLALKRLLEAASAADAGDTAKALADYDAVASDGTLPETLGHLALLKRVLLAGPEMSAADRGAALERLTRPGAPYRLLAQEQQALDLAAAGDTDGAVAALRAVLAEDGVTPGLRRRATQLMVALGADPAAS